MTLYIFLKFYPLPVKADIVTEVSFLVFRHVGDVTVGGRSVGSTSGLAFSVRGNLNRLTCSGVLLVSAYSRCGGRSKSQKKRKNISSRELRSGNLAVLVMLYNIPVSNVTVAVAKAAI